MCFQMSDAWMTAEAPSEGIQHQRPSALLDARENRMVLSVQSANSVQTFRLPSAIALGTVVSGLAQAHHVSPGLEWFDD